MPTAKNGDTVAIDFVVKTEAGQVVGNTEESGPQVVTLGKQEIFPQIEAALDGMEVGSVQQVKIDSDNAFGPKRFFKTTLWRPDDLGIVANHEIVKDAGRVRSGLLWHQAR